MKNEYTALIKQEGDCWVGWIEEIPGINCQESTREELVKSLKVTLKEALELNRKDAIDAAPNDYQEEQIAILKRKKLIKYLQNNGCEFVREGGWPSCRASVQAGWMS